MEQVLKCLVIDDDPDVNAYVCDMVVQTSFLDLAGSLDNAQAALSEMENGAIDLLILDINLPGVDGVTFAGTLKELPARAAPRVILISGSGEHALAGYKVDAIDYLLKPFTYEAFYKAALKARNLSKAPAAAVANDHLFLKVEHDLVRVDINEIKYLESARDYVKVVTNGSTIIALSTMKALEEKLKGHRFMRVHRSFIINLDKIDAIQHLTVRFGKTVIPVTEQYRDAFKAVFSDWL
ncbi:hypothetical protein BC343_25665 [Mucilaginibacter pedocola]|uniref:DNA-binding response regulator n=2 Tax=Mucilaginibacter pedocola TaxID=1792845 RepID=A0A1S9PHN2_9SPHI|nr:hypothetical protein BC343_25665 [Mucilaginibacter pedocola]